MAKQGLSLSELAAELERTSQSRADYIAPQGKIEARVSSVDPGTHCNDGSHVPDIVIDGLNGAAKPLTPHAHGQLAGALGIPKAYYDRMRAEQPALLASNVNTWLRAEPDAKHMVRTVDGKVRAILSPKYRPLDNFELAGAILPQLCSMRSKVISSALTETRMYIKIILPDLSSPLPEGLEWGNGHHRIAEYNSNRAGMLVAALTISNSEVGAGSLRVEPSVFTTWCTNLAVMTEASMRKYHVGRAFSEGADMSVFRDETRAADDRAFFLKVRDVVADAFRPETFQAAVAQIKDAGQRKIDGALDKVVESAVKTLALPVGTQSTILDYLAKGGDFSAWGLSSAITATANNADSYELASELERAGGKVLALPATQWDRIAHAAA